VSSAETGKHGPDRDADSARVVYHTTVNLEAAPTTPSLDLYQPTFPLSEADYLRLTQASPAFAAIGSVFVTFGLTYILPIAVKVLDAEPKLRTWPKADLYIAGGCILLGIICMVLSYWFSSARRDVFRRIRNHFRDNPGHHRVSRS